jgi:hypothetical protein
MRIIYHHLSKLTQLNVQLHDEAIVAIAYDTRFVHSDRKRLIGREILSRSSSPLLSNIVKRAAEIFYTNVMDFGRRIFCKICF